MGGSSNAALLRAAARWRRRVAAAAWQAAKRRAACLDKGRQDRLDKDRQDGRRAGQGVRGRRAGLRRQVRRVRGWGGVPGSG